MVEPNRVGFEKPELHTDSSDFDKFGIGNDIGRNVQGYVPGERSIFSEIDEERLVLMDRFSFRLPTTDETIVNTNEKKLLFLL